MANLKSHDELYEMYKRDPDEFESYARNQINNAIEKIAENATEEQVRRIKALQWRIDMELRKYKDPIARMNKMVEMFWDGVNIFADALKGK